MDNGGVPESIGLERTMKRLFLTAAAGLALAAAALAQGTVLSSTYVLDRNSMLALGCVGGCACPIWLVPDFRGTFDLKKVTSPDPAFEQYAITSVNWLAGHANGEVRVVGSGTYKVGSSSTGPVQRLILDLRVGEAPVDSYDSGLIAGGTGGEFPTIDVPLALANPVCFGAFLHVSAGAAPLSALVHYKLAAGTFQEGCLPPCMCPLMQEVPVTGTFDLVPIWRNPPSVEYGVVNLDWAIHSFPPPLPAFIPVNGAGIYQLFGGWPGSPHRMLLDLEVGGADEHYDSGLVRGSSMPIIPISLAMNGFFCYDRVFVILAVPR